MQESNTILTTDLLKNHMRFENATCEDDTLFTLYLRAAQSWIEQYCGRPYADLEIPRYDDTELPADIVLATLMLASYFYEQRETVAFGMPGDHVPFGVLDLIRSYRVEVTGHVRT